MTAELEVLFRDLRNPQLDESRVVELSDIVGCSLAEQNALLIRHEGNLERAVRSHIAAESRREGSGRGAGKGKGKDKGA